mgnify:CR=1 FL=1
MNLKEIREILELLKGSDVSEFELGRGDTVLKLRRGPANAPVVLPPPGPAAPARPASVPPAAASVPPKPTYKEIVSPIVGTFYRSAKPDSEPFVNVGDEVGPEKVLCIIEAMKVMNEIKAEIGGTVREILVKNGQAVEFGEPLFLIEKE